MNIKLQSMAPVLGMFITTGGIIFQIGKHSERLEVIGLKVEAQEKEVQNTYQGINQVNNKLNIITNDMGHVKKDINDIKNNMIIK
tara:strand:- start:2133 stop:2387 length:255 start_codon:yes stop_codon:yes gene_type:complete